MKHAWILLGAAALASACSTIFGDFVVEDTATSSPTSTGTGAATSTSSATTSSATTSSATTSSASSSGSTCQSTADCDVEHVCSSSGVCLLINGQPCATASSCNSAFCVDGVCCNEVCNSACQACSAALTGGAEGTCAPATNGTADPRALCAATAATTCGTNGKCSAGACAYWPVSTVCGTVTNSCMTVGGDVFVDTKVCNGSGVCNPEGTAMCSAAWGCGMDESSCGCGTSSDCPAALPVCSSESECTP